MSAAAAASPFPGFADYATAPQTPLSVRLASAKTLRDFAAQSLAYALRNVELATLAAKAAEAEYRAVEAETHA